MGLTLGIRTGDRITLSSAGETLTVKAQKIDARRDSITLVLLGEPWDKMHARAEGRSPHLHFDLAGHLVHVSARIDYRGEGHVANITFDAPRAVEILREGV